MSGDRHFPERGQFSVRRHDEIAISRMNPLVHRALLNPDIPLRPQSFILFGRVPRRNPGAWGSIYTSSARDRKKKD
jgi:hypothetical protein